MPRQSKRALPLRRRRPARSNATSNPSSFIHPVQSIMRSRLVYRTNLLSSGGGTIAFVLAVDPSVSTEFAAFAELYDAYRVVGGLITLPMLPPVETSGSSKLNNALFVCYDSNDSITPTAAADLLDNGTRRIYQTINMSGAPITFRFRVPTSGVGTSILWSNTSTSSLGYGSIKFFSEGLTASTYYFTVIADFYVEFRGRR